MKLYFNPRSRAVIARWMLDEAGVEYEIIPIDLRKHEHKTPEFLKVNPAGKLPALVDGDTRVFENAALCLYVADRYPQARLAPAIDAPERGRYLSLVVYSTSQLEPSAADHMTKTATLPQRGWTEYPLALDAVERELGNGPYLFGDWFTAADVMIGSIFIYQRLLGARTDRPALDAYVDRLMARPKGMKLG